MKRRQIGVVASDGNLKTRRVEVERTFLHPKYGKTVRKRVVCHVHDEHEVSRVGDRVEIVESRPMSRLKRWVLVRVVST